jgi:undecaprenyl-diphosphatase
MESATEPRHGAPADTPRRTTNGQRVAVLASGLSIAALVATGVQAWNNDVASWDRQLSESIHAYENRDTFLDRFDVFGFVLDPAMQILGLLVFVGAAVALVSSGYRRVALAFVVAIVGATALGVILKEAIARPPVDPSPDAGGYSFPSGHALRSMVVALALAVIAWPTPWRWPVAAAGAITVGLTGIGVVYHEWHWASDVVGGWCIAVAWLACVWLALRPPPLAGHSVARRR